MEALYSATVEGNEKGQRLASGALLGIDFLMSKLFPPEAATPEAEETFVDPARVARKKKP